MDPVTLILTVSSPEELDTLRRELAPDTMNVHDYIQAMEAFAEWEGCPETLRHFLGIRIQQFKGLSRLGVVVFGSGEMPDEDSTS